MSEIKEELHQVIVDAIEYHGDAISEFELRELKNPDNKWFVKSALQKAIRRGQVDEALRMASYSLGMGRDEAWKGLAVILVEDVGIGDLDLVAYSTLVTTKTFRKGLDEDLLYAAMILRACLAPKSRSCCELELGVNMIMGVPDRYTGEVPDTIYRQRFNDMLNEPMEKHLPRIIPADTSLDCIERAQLANLSLRKRLRGQGQAALFPALELIRDALDNETEQRASMLSFERTADTMNLALFPIIKWLNMRGEEVYEHDEKADWPELPDINNFHPEVFDMHTRAGKTAIREWHKWLCSIDSIFSTMSGGKAYGALGAICFVLEGGLVDRRLRSPGLDLLKKYQDHNFIRGFGASNAVMEDLNSVMEVCDEGLWKLNELREWSLGKG